MTKGKGNKQKSVQKLDMLDSSETPGSVVDKKNSTKNTKISKKKK